MTQDSSVASADSNNGSSTNYLEFISSDLVDIPESLRHDSGKNVSLYAILVALLIAVLGASTLGAGYGAIQALCGEHLVNIALFCSIPFWLNVPAELGFYLGNLRDRRWQLRVEIIGLVACLYAVQVGWLYAVLDGPGLVLNPLQLLGHILDIDNYGIWVEAVPFIDLRPELLNLKPFLIGLRVVEFSWLVIVGLMTLGDDLSFPYCQNCNRWMSDAEQVRLGYDAVDLEDVRALASDLVEGEYDGLITLSDPVKPKGKGLHVKVFSCPKCKEAHVLDMRWFRPSPDPEETATEQLLSSAAGVQVVSRLKVSAEVPAHISEIASRKAA